MAFLQPYENIIFMGKYFYKEELVHNNIVIKTHDKSIDEWNKKFQDIYDLYYIISDRHDYDWDTYRNNKNFLFITYEELLENDKNPIEQISLNVFNKVNDFL